MEKYTYLLLDFFTVVFPLLFSFHPKIKFYKFWKSFLPINFSVAFVFIFWDVWYTHLGVWGFNEKYLTGFYVFNLPVEETLFFICIPYACVFTYFVFTRLVLKNDYQFLQKIITPILIFGLLSVAIFNSQKLYTAATFFSLAVVLAFIQYVFKQKFLSHFFLIYPVLLIPFFIVNGILTGSFIHYTVVFYNDAENLGIRLLTIPVEDIFYGMLLLVLNVGGMEYYTNSFTKCLSE